MASSLKQYDSASSSTKNYLNEACLILYVQDMVLLHHEIEVEFPDGQPTENHAATLLEFGKTMNGKMITAMALTVGIPAAIGAMVFAATSLTFLYIFLNYDYYQSYICFLLFSSYL